MARVDDRTWRREAAAATVFRVMDTIEHRAEWTRRYPQMAARGDGLLVILEPSGPSPDSSLVGQAVTVRRPDVPRGSTVMRTSG